jgi:hypothetical protein
LIIDSTSHCWDALLERIDQTADHKYKGNSFRAWGEGTPLQRRLIEKMLSYPGHIIATCRSKTGYAIDKDETNKTVITKAGAAPVQRQGFEYEFTTAVTMDRNHVGMAAKDRTGKYQDRFIKEPGRNWEKNWRTGLTKARKTCTSWGIG